MDSEQYKRIGLDDMNISDYVSNGSFFIFVSIPIQHSDNFHQLSSYAFHTHLLFTMQTVDSFLFPLETLKTLIITEKVST